MSRSTIIMGQINGFYYGKSSYKLAHFLINSDYFLAPGKYE